MIGSTPAEQIKKYVDESNLVLFDVYSKCADALRTGQVQAVTTDNVILLGLVQQSGGQFKMVEKPFTREPYGIGIRKGDVKFCEFIDQALTQAAQDGFFPSFTTFSVSPPRLHADLPGPDGLGGLPGRGEGHRALFPHPHARSAAAHR